MIPVADMVDHVERLCRSHEPDPIALYYSRGRKAYALRDPDEIFVAPIKSVITYAVALHEIGHIKGRYQLSWRCIVRERWAWEWAKRNAGMDTRDGAVCSKVPAVVCRHWRHHFGSKPATAVGELG